MIERIPSLLSDNTPSAKPDKPSELQRYRQFLVNSAQTIEEFEKLAESELHTNRRAELLSDYIFILERYVELLELKVNIPSDFVTKKPLRFLAEAFQMAGRGKKHPFLEFQYNDGRPQLTPEQLFFRCHIAINIELRKKKKLNRTFKDAAISLASDFRHRGYNEAKDLEKLGGKSKHTALPSLLSEWHAFIKYEKFEPSNRFIKPYFNHCLEVLNSNLPAVPTDWGMPS